MAFSSSLVELIILLISIGGATFLGMAIFRANRKSETHKLFTALVGVTVVWLVTTYAALKMPKPYDILLVRTTMLLAAFQIWYLFRFVHSFPRPQGTLSDSWKRFGWIALAIVSAIAISPFMFTEVKDGQTVAGPGIIAFLLFALGMVGSSAVTLIRKLIRSKGVSHQQLQVLTTGIGISFGLIALTNFGVVVFAKNASLINLTPLYALILIGFVAYAVAAYHLFDIRVVIKRTVIFTALVTFTFSIYTIIILLVSRIFQQDQITDVASFLTNLVAALAVGFSFEPIKRWISDRTDRWLFKKEYEQQTVISSLSKKLNDVIALDEALEIVMQTIVKVLHLKHAVTYVFQPGENKSFAVKRVKQVGYSNHARLILDDRDFTVQYFTDHAKTMLLQDFNLELEREQALLERNTKEKPKGEFIREHAIKQAVSKKLLDLETAVAIPLHLNNQPIGLVLLSEKLNGEGYHQQDLALLELVGEQAISSIQKAKLYEGDQMKSEFVSIASHELLTPISAMEGYLSMILEENIGKVDDQARDYLNKVYTSAKRLSLLIKDLLSVSRIESGKMKVEAQQLDIGKMITDTLDQLHFMAANKGLELKYQAPAEPYPPVWADPDRTMQVMVNLVSNAIKYTKSGSVTISVDVDKAEGVLKTSVTDTGMGMSKSAQQHLFTKFYRVDSPETTGIVGTGLGLYITKSIIEKMGGFITCKSTEGQGSTFAFTLPLFKVETSKLD